MPPTLFPFPWGNMIQVDLKTRWNNKDQMTLPGDQPWVFIGKTDVEAETPVLWPPDAKSWLIGKDPDAGKDWGQEEKGTTENEMIGWHHQLNGDEFGWTPGVGHGQGGLTCCGSWGRKESDTTEWLNWADPPTRNNSKQNMWNDGWLLKNNFIYF